MAQIASWNGHTFEVSAQLIRSFTDLSLKGSCETEDKKSGGQQYVKRKNGKPAELSLTVGLNAQLGVTDVRSEALAYVQEASDGATEYFYIGTKKLIDAKMMLTSAEVTEYATMPANGDKWISCDVKLTFKQASKNEGGGSGSGGSGGSSRRPKKKKKSARGGGDLGAGDVLNMIGQSLRDKCKQGSADKLYNKPGTAAQSYFNKLPKTSRNSGSKINPTTGRGARGTGRLMATK